MWQLVRFYLVVASLAVCFWIVWTKLKGSSDPLWLDMLVLGSFVLNVIYLLLGKTAREPSRLARLIGLWFDAKEVELRRRAGAGNSN
jgi:hypothetical protein